MQKYAHRGAFYMDDSVPADDVRRRVLTDAPADAPRNRDAIPEAARRRNFGKRGQSRYGGLAKEDTSGLRDAYTREAARYAGGGGGGGAAPSRSRVI